MSKYWAKSLILNSGNCFLLIYKLLFKMNQIPAFKLLKKLALINFLLTIWQWSLIDYVGITPAISCRPLDFARHDNFAINLHLVRSAWLPCYAAFDWLRDDALWLFSCNCHHTLFSFVLKLPYFFLWLFLRSINILDLDNKKPSKLTRIILNISINLEIYAEQ